MYKVLLILLFVARLSGMIGLGYILRRGLGQFVRAGQESNQFKQVFLFRTIYSL